MTERTIQQWRKKREYEKILLLSCIKKGKIKVKWAIKKTNFSKQKVIALLKLLEKENFLKQEGKNLYVINKNF